MSEPRYKRNQVEAALWKAFAAGRTKGPAPKVFTTRIKRLLELDRESEATEAASYAFHDDPPGGLGVDTAFSEQNVFCLAIGLDLLDIGFKQREVVFLLKHLRPKLDKRHAQILRHPPALRMPIAAEHRLDCPSYQNGEYRYADCRIFMLVNKVEMTELYPLHNTRSPLILEPKFVRGIEELRTELHLMNYDYRRILVLELAEFAVMIKGELEKTEPVSRGRPAA